MRTTILLTHLSMFIILLCQQRQGCTQHPSYESLNIKQLLLSDTTWIVFTGPVPVTAREHTTPQYGCYTLELGLFTLLGLTRSKVHLHTPVFWLNVRYVISAYIMSYIMPYISAYTMPYIMPVFRLNVRYVISAYIGLRLVYICLCLVISCL